MVRLELFEVARSFVLRDATFMHTSIRTLLLWPSIESVGTASTPTTPLAVQWQRS